MFTILSAITGLELVFVLCAILGGGLFVVRLILMFLGGGHGDTDATAVDYPDAGGADFHHDMSDSSDLSFKSLSLQGLTAFFMMFGLVGWAMLRQSKLPAGISLIGAAAAGAGTVWLVKQIFRWAGALQSSGTLNLHNAVGCEGTVYLTIKPGQTGKVQVTVQGRLMELDARSESDQEIKTGEPIRVVHISNNILIVEKI
ncbi:MAG: NfeD family protein [Sedimentisphaerales bacterium]|nr:NfeD family protein [Sedimentisphaerales bacterium]